MSPEPELPLRVTTGALVVRENNGMSPPDARASSIMCINPLQIFGFIERHLLPGQTVTVTIQVEESIAPEETLQVFYSD